MKSSSIKQTFCELVALDSVSKNEVKVVSYVIKELEKLGIKAEQDKIGNVIGYIPGDGEPLLLNAHLDRVPLGKGNTPIFNGTVAKSDGSTNLGADDAAGITVILDAVKEIIHSKKSHVPLVLAFTVQEEIGLFGAQALDVSKYGVTRGLIFDNAFEAGVVVSKGAGYLAFDIEIKGKEAHSGKDLKNGINALSVFLKANIPLGEFDDGQTRINVGTVVAGKMRNAVPGSVLLQGEIRSFLSKEKIAQRFESIKSSFEKVAQEVGCELSIKTFQLPSYSIDITEPLLQLYKHILQKRGATLQLKETFVGSDVNALRGRQGLKMLLISTGVFDEHTVNETFDLKDLEMLKKDLVDLIYSL